VTYTQNNKAFSNFCKQKFKLGVWGVNPKNNVSN
jgi:hypothetical protein